MDFFISTSEACLTTGHVGQRNNYPTLDQPNKLSLVKADDYALYYIIYLKVYTSKSKEECNKMCV